MALREQSIGGGLIRNTTSSERTSNSFSMSKIAPNLANNAFKFGKNGSIE